MRELSELTAAQAKGLRGLVFDLDGTVLTDGALGLEAYRALFELRAAGLFSCACTGRPAGWGAVIARQWPIDLAVTENGAIAFARDGARIVTLDPHEEERPVRKARLDAIAAELSARFPEVPLADDNPERRSDVTFDVAETVAIPRERVAELHRAAHTLGARTFESSIHLHVTLENADKASGTLAALSRRTGIDRTAALAGFAFAGDSSNDESCFAAFRLTFGVANVLRYVPRLSLPPRFVSRGEQGAGFAQIVARIVQLRGQP